MDRQDSRSLLLVMTDMYALFLYAAEAEQGVGGAVRKACSREILCVRYTPIGGKEGGSEC